MDRLEPRGVDMGVDLSRRDAGVPEHFLNLAQVCAPREKVRRETVSEGMRTDVFRRAHPRRVSFEKFPYPFSAQASATVRQEQPRGSSGRFSADTGRSCSK